jgi:hypothetical protein
VHKEKREDLHETPGRAAGYIHSTSNRPGQRKPFTSPVTTISAPEIEPAKKKPSEPDCTCPPPNLVHVPEIARGAHHPLSLQATKRSASRIHIRIVEKQRQNENRTVKL